MRATGVWRGIIALALALPLATAPLRRATATSSLASVVAGDVARAAHDDHAPGGGAGADGLTAFPRTLPITGYALALDERAGRAYVTDDRGIGVIDTRTGALLRTVVVGKGHPFAVAVDAAGRVYAAAGFPSAIVALDARTGVVLYRARVRGLPRALVPVPGTRLLIVVTAHEQGSGALGTVDVLDTRTRAIRQIVARAQADFAAIAVDGRTGRAFVSDAAGNAVDMVDTRRGQLLHMTPVGEFPSAVMVTPDDRVFVGTATGVSVLDAHTGARLHTLAHPRIVAAIAVDAPRRRVFIADSEGDDYSVYTFDARTTALLHRTNPDPTNVGRAPVALAVDGARSRVYALLGSQLDKNFMPVGPASVAMIDATTGALRRSVNLGDTVTLGGGYTYGLAMDTRAQRLIALTDTHVVVLDTTHL